ncbi:MAG: PKD domain-containing protein, partial [Acidimicrobiales bacterium]
MNRESTLLWSRRSAALLVLALLVVMAFRIGSSSSAEVQFRDPTAWLESAATGEVIKINGATSEVSARIEVAEPGNDLDVVQAGPSAFVLDTNAMRLGNADGVLLRLLPTIDISGTVGRPMLAASENAVFVIDDDSVAVFSATDLAAEESFALDSPLLQVVADSNGSVWGVDQAGGLIHADKDRIRRTTPTDAVGEALEVVAVAGEPYLIDFSTDQAWHVTPKGGLGESICIAGSPGSTARSGGTTAADDDRFILISDGASGKLHLGELDSGECDVIDIAAPGSELGSPVEAAGTSYVANYTTGQVTIIDLAARRVLRTVRVSSPGVIDLIVKDGLVWFNDPDGANAGIIEVDRVRPVSKFDTSNAGEGIGGSEVAETGSSLDDAGVASAEVTGGEQGSGAIDGDGPGESGAESSALADDGGGDKESILPPIGDDPSLVPAEEPDAVDEPEPVVEDPSDSAELDEPLPVDTDRLQADFSFSSDQIQVGEEVTLADSSLGSPDSWSWTFDDGTSANGPRIRKSWPIEGTYVVTLFVDNSTDSDSAEHTFVVLPNSVDIAPRADFRFDNGTIETGDSVRFTDRSTGSPTRLEWNFGDGRTATGNSVTNSYAAPGRYTVTLRASNNAGSDTATVSILVLDSVEAPTAIISVATLSAEVGDFIVFRSQSTGTPTSLEWDFDDESGASGTEVQHSFSTPGTYQVSLTASNSAGSDTDTIAITIRAPIDAPVARIDGSSTRNVSAGVELCFVSTSTKNPSSLSWDFGDGGTAAGQAVCHSYDEKGSYRVTLVAANAAGSDEARIRVRVAEPPPAPTASFVASPSR